MGTHQGALEDELTGLGIKFSVTNKRQGSIRNNSQLSDINNWSFTELGRPWREAYVEEKA